MNRYYRRLPNGGNSTSPMNRRFNNCTNLWLIALALFGSPVAGAADEPEAGADPLVQGGDAVPDVRDDESELTVQKKDFVIVPIPMSNPTLETGLILGAAYFYRQTDAQKAVQPPSVTGAAGFYTSNDSLAYAVGHQSYWSENKWRASAVIGHVNLNLDFEAGVPGRGLALNWNLDGEFVQGKIARKFAGKWYAGAKLRYIDMDQAFTAVPFDVILDVAANTKAKGAGVYFEYDNRDKPMNSYTGNMFEFDVMFSEADVGISRSYESYNARYRSYHSLSDSVVLAWELAGCKRSPRAPLWDACRVGLRGFNATRYLGTDTGSGQVEMRWRFHRKFGAVAFAGAGYYETVVSNFINEDIVPSYGVGLRYMLLESQRVNLRVDYARSEDTDAWYLSVGESF